MIKIPTNSDLNESIIRYIEEEYERGVVSYYLDHKNHIFTFYNPEDEAAFVLRFGKNFLSYAETGMFYCPYVPTNIKKL